MSIFDPEVKIKPKHKLGSKLADPINKDQYSVCKIEGKTIHICMTVPYDQEYKTIIPFKSENISLSVLVDQFRNGKMEEVVELMDYLKQLHTTEVEIAKLKKFEEVTDE